MSDEATLDIDRKLKNQMQKNDLDIVFDIGKSYVDLEDPPPFIAVFDKVAEEAIKDLCGLLANIPWSLANPVVLQMIADALATYEKFYDLAGPAATGGLVPLDTIPVRFVPERVREIKVRGKINELNLRIKAIRTLVDSVESSEKLEGFGIEGVYQSCSCLCSFIGSNMYLLDNEVVFSEIKELVKRGME